MAWMPWLRTSPVTQSGVSEAKLVATREAAISHQNTLPSPVKNVRMLAPAFLCTAKPIQSIAPKYKTTTIQSVSVR